MLSLLSACFLIYIIDAVFLVIGLFVLIMKIGKVHGSAWAVDIVLGLANMAQSVWSANESDGTNGGFKIQLLFAAIVTFHKNICRDVWKDLKISILSHDGYSAMVVIGILFLYRDIPQAVKAAFKAKSTSGEAS